MHKAILATLVTLVGLSGCASHGDRTATPADAQPPTEHRVSSAAPSTPAIATAFTEGPMPDNADWAGHAVWWLRRNEQLANATGRTQPAPVSDERSKCESSAHTMRCFIASLWAWCCVSSR